MRTTGLMTALMMAFGFVLFLGAPVMAEEGEQQPATEVATEVEAGTAESPPVEAAPPEGQQESEKAAEPEQD